MSSSSNSTVERLKQQAEAYKPAAQKEMLDKLRAEKASLEERNRTLQQQVDETSRRIDYMMEDFAVLLDFIHASGVELTDDLANVVGKHEELRIIRRVHEEVTGKPKTGMLYLR